MNATPLEPKHPLEAEKFLLNKGVAVPFPKPRPSEDTAWKVGFSTPNGILLVGSWATKSGAKSPGSLAWVVDMAVEMPAVSLNIHLFAQKIISMPLRRIGIVSGEGLSRQSVLPQTCILLGSYGLHDQKQQRSQCRCNIRLRVVGHTDDDASALIPTRLAS